MTPMHIMASDLLWIIWRGIPADYKSRYRTTIWRQFEDRIRSAAYTSSLGTFVNSVCLSLNATIGKRRDEREQANELLNANNDAAILKLMREEATLLVLIVRVKNQQVQDNYRDREVLRKQTATALEGALFEGIE